MSLRQTRLSRGVANDRKNQEHIRNLAVSLVDMEHGYTMEFAGSPAGHREQYDRVEDMIKIAMDTGRLRLVRVNRK